MNESMTDLHQGQRRRSWHVCAHNDTRRAPFGRAQNRRSVRRGHERICANPYPNPARLSASFCVRSDGGLTHLHKQLLTEPNVLTKARRSEPDQIESR